MFSSGQQYTRHDTSDIYSVILCSWFNACHELSGHETFAQDNSAPLIIAWQPFLPIKMGHLIAATSESGCGPGKCQESVLNWQPEDKVTQMNQISAYADNEWLSRTNQFSL